MAVYGTDCYVHKQHIKHGSINSFGASISQSLAILQKSQHRFHGSYIIDIRIILSCGTTVFACTWSVQHLNVPAAHDGIWKKILRSCQWMIITILFPEFIITHAFFEFLMAVEATKLIEEKGEMVLAYPSLIRRIFVRSHTQNNDSEQGKDYKGPEWTLTHSYFANMGGLSFEHTDETDEQRSTQFPLTAFQYAQSLIFMLARRFTKMTSKTKANRITSPR